MSGRPILIPTPLSLFLNDTLVPTAGELVVDDVDNNGLGIMVPQQNGSLAFISLSEQLKALIDQFDQTGVFENAAAFAQNRKVYRFFFDNARKTVRIDPDLRFSSSYRYYAIRKATKNINGTYDYVTGWTQDDGFGTQVVVSNLVDLDLETTSEGTTVRVPQIGNLLENLTNTEFYVVEYYDEDEIMVTSDPYQAIVAAAIDFDLTPDVAITDMFVSTNRPYAGDPDGCFVYQHEGVENLDIRVFLKYSDGTTRDITNELSTGGRLTITGLNLIDSTDVDLTGTQTFEVTYRFTAANSQQTGGSTQTGGTIDTENRTITRTMKVYVKTDIFDTIESITPASWISGDVSAASGTINLKIFGNYRSGAVRDITPMCTITGFTPDDNQIGGVPQNVIVTVPQGHGNQTKTFTFTLGTSRDHRYVSITNMAKHDGRIHRLVAEDNNGSDVFRFALAALGGGSPPVPNTFFTTNYGFTNPDDSVVHTVTHFRIRNIIMDSNYVYTDRTAIDSSVGQFAYTVHAGKELYNEYPVLVELIEVVMSGQSVVSVYSTGSMICYIQLGL